MPATRLRDGLRDNAAETQYDRAMRPQSKIRLGALLAAIAVTTVLALLFAPVANGVDHLLRHAIASLSPSGRAIVGAIGSSLPYWLPATVIALLAWSGVWGRKRRDDADDAPRDVR